MMMMPNSRLIPTQRKRSNSASPSYSIENNKKGFMSRLLPKSNEPSSQSKQHGIGKLFRKMSGNKSLEASGDDIPQVRPVRPSHQHAKIPLAPAPVQRPRRLSQPMSQQFLTCLPHEYLSQPMQATPTRPTQRKSDGSMSIYSTFGYSQDSMTTTSGGAERRVGSCSSSSFFSEDEFVDAHGYTQDELEKNPPDEALDQSMLNWKRHSGTSAHKRWSQPPVPVVLVQEEEDPYATARLLWQEDPAAVVSKEKMAEWLGLGQPFQAKVLSCYMQLFDFSAMRLDMGFRRLCSKLYFKAEAQQIDRILEVFAHRYWECNPDCLLGSADVVYAVVYSLLLLNTDLHVAQGKHARMTRSEFIKNTMATLSEQEESAGQRSSWEAEVENYLKDLYLSVKQHQILQPLSQQSAKRKSSLLGNRRVAGLKRSVNSMIRKSGIVDSMILPEDFYPTSMAPRVSVSSSSHQTRRESFSSSSQASFSSRPGSPTLSQGLFCPKALTSQEGRVIRKHLFESQGVKAKHREWKECSLEINAHGELTMSGLENRKQSSNGWLGKMALNHTLSNLLPPPGYSRHRPFVFAIQQADGGVYLFQTASHEQALGWVSTCNYWAARTSKGPLAGGIGNMEYGWGHCLDDVVMDLDAIESGAHFTLEDPDQVTIHAWQPPSASMVSSTLDEGEQLVCVQAYLEELNEAINEHRERKSKLTIKFPSQCRSYGQVMTNWENRAHYLLHEIIKYQHYRDALEKNPRGETGIEQRLIYQMSQVDLFKEITQELHLNSSFLLGEGSLHGLPP
ncbi:hypothetical protein BY458DRAFT_520605 [Sporodiniella umbellata]|nr:hypothetical protein BY458DRAFT_520605 [Sporodiniella umbellata]